MSALAKEHNAINLSQGFPDFLCRPELINLVDSFMRKGLNQYAPMQGLLSLREQIAIKYEKLYGAVIHPDSEITITSGGTEAIYCAITSVVQPGDEVIVFEPAYDCYVPAIQLNGGLPVFIPLTGPEYNIPWAAVRAAISPRTRLIVLNTPHNPTGSMWSQEDCHMLIDCLRQTNSLLLSDEVYEHIVFDGRQHESMLRFAELRERSFVIFSFGKTYHNTGWKIGYCIAPAMLTAEFRKIHQFVVFSSNTPLQYAFAEAMKHPDWYEELPAFYQQKRDLFLQLLQGSRFTWKPAKGSYFQLLNYSRISDEPDTELAVRLTRQIGVASIPVSVFYNKPVNDFMLRFCFAKSEETLQRAAERLIRV
jgi:methionine aminotransferase